MGLTEAVAGPSSTRERLLAAATEAFAEKGYQAATTREIAARAGVAELTLFRHFSSKQGLFEALLERARPVRVLEELMASPEGSSPSEELASLGRRLVEHIGRNHQLIRLLLWEPHAHPELAAQVAQFPPQLRAWLGHYLEEAAARYGWPARDWYTCAQGFFGMIFGYAMTRAVLAPDPRLAPPEEAVALYVEIFLAGLVGKSGA